MASISDVASAWVDVQLEVSRLRHSVVAGEKAAFSILDELISRAKGLVVSEDEPVKAAGPDPENVPASTEVPTPA